jgi:hypothetical protein
MFIVRREHALAARVAVATALSFGSIVTSGLSAFAADDGRSMWLTVEPGNPMRSGPAHPLATNRLELLYPELARRFGSDPRVWPGSAFKDIDCNLPSNGCPEAN